MLPKYSPAVLFLIMFLCCLGVSTSASRFFHWRFVSIQSLLESKSPHGIFLDTYTVVRLQFQTIPLLHMLEWFQDHTLYPAVVFVFVMLLLFWFSISSLSLLDMEACDLLSLITHKGNNYHSLVISISVELLLSVLNHYKSLLVWLLCLFSLDFLSILFNPRFKHFYAIEFTVLLIRLFFCWR